MKTLRWAGFLVVLSLGSAGADTLYNNTTTRENNEFADGTTEFGNEVTLAGNGPFTITNFSFEYYGLNFSGGEQADVRFYENNGATFNGFATPNTLLYDSGQFSVNQGDFTLDFNPQNSPGFDFSATNDITYTVQFSGVGPTNAGVVLYYPPSVGTNFGDMWVNSGSGWQLEQDTNAPLSIGAQIQGSQTQPVPEPTAVMLGLAGGVAGLLLVFRSRRQA